MIKLDIGEIAVWAVAVGAFAGMMIFKPFTSYSPDVTEPETLETVAASYAADISTSEELLSYEPEETEPETLADIEDYLEAWSFSDKMSMDLSESDISALQRVAIAEAGVDGVEGEALVIRVVLNRVYSDEFPNSVMEVISQENQFTTYSNGTFEAAVPDETSAEAWHMVENGWDESQGAMWFEKTTDEATWHSENLTYLFSYGGHSFYTE